MPETRTLLFEIGTEELPPKSLKNLADALHNQLIENLHGIKLINKPVASKVFATPRRMAVQIEQVCTKQPDQVIHRKGPAVSQAYDEQGQPTRAAIGFASSVGVEIGDLDRTKTDKGEWLFCKMKQPGQDADKLIPQAVESALAALPIPKPMRWGALDAEFIRPVKWIVIMLGDRVIEAEILSIKSGRLTYGHRFHTSGPLRFKHAAEYENTLEREGHVIPDFDKRRKLILDGIKRIAGEKKSRVLLDNALLDEVTGLVELPVVLMGSIDEAYMHLPKEVLITSMQNHQKYFPVVDTDNKMLPYFITVSNIRSKKSQNVIKGNERVLRARLADAQFFYNSDRKITLEQRTISLAEILFHKKLGTLGDKVNRLVRLSAYLAEQLDCEFQSLSRSAQLCKADLLTDMVGEFPDLQGGDGQVLCTE